MVHEQWLQLKMLFLLGYNLKLWFSGGDLNFGGGGGKNLVGGIFPGGREWVENPVNCGSLTEFL